MEDYTEARRKMVDNQIRPQDVTDYRLLDAVSAVPREKFVPAADRGIAYCDLSVEIKAADEGRPARYLGDPAPLIRLMQLAAIGSEDIILDVGCGTGYSTAVLAAVSNSVVALEDDEDLAARADEILSSLGIDNCAVVTGPLENGYPSEGPYDVIFFNGSIEVLPESIKGQLKDGGRLVVMMRNSGGGQTAWLYHCDDGRISERFGFNSSLPPLPGFSRAAEFVF